MAHLVISLAAFAAAALALFSRFGVGTLLTSMFAVFCPRSALL